MAISRTNVTRALLDQMKRSTRSTFYIAQWSSRCFWVVHRQSTQAITLVCCCSPVAGIEG